MTNGYSERNSNQNDALDLPRLFGTLWRGKWVVLAATAASFFLALYFALVLATPMYPARATIALQDGNQSIIGDIESIFAGGGADATSMNTELEVIRSRQLVGQLVDDLQLVSDPEFNPALDAPSWIGGLVQRLRQDSGEHAPETLRNAVIDSVTSEIRVSGIRLSSAFTVSMETTSPEKSARIVNRLAELYIENQIIRKLEAATQAISFLSDRTSELALSVEDLEQQLAQRSEIGQTTSPEIIQVLTQQLGDLRQRIDAEHRQNEDRVELAHALRSAATTDDRLRIALTSGEVELSRLAQGADRSESALQGFDAAIEVFLSGLDRDVLRATQQVEALEASAATLSSRIARQAQSLIELQQLEREASAARLLYETFLTRLQEASVQQGLETADARILSEAVPRPASSPRVGLIVAMALTLGAMTGSLIVLAAENRFAGIRTRDDLKDTAQLPVFATLPRLPVTSRDQVLACLKDNPTSLFSEAVRDLRTSVLLSSSRSAPQVILLTSSVPAEGKTTLAIALSRSLQSLEGKRVLLLEADLRRKTLQSYVDRNPGASLIDVLSGRVSIEECRPYDADFGVDVLSGGKAQINAADLFSSPRFNTLMERLRQSYDHIVIDSPPVLAVPDARAIAQHADVTVFVARWSSTTRLQIRQGLDMLKTVGHPADGVVLSQIDLRRMKSYGYSGQYGYDSDTGAYYGAT